MIRVSKDNYLSFFKKIPTFPIKIAIVFFAVFFIYREISLKIKYSDVELLFSKEFFINNFYWILILLSLTFVNWWIEAVKWQILINYIEKISIIRSLSAVFSGVTVSIFTPNRIGEYGGRIFYLRPEHRIEGVVVTFIGSVSQLAITVILGFISMLFYVGNISKTTSYSLVIISLVILSGAIIYLLLNFYQIPLILDKIKYLKKFSRHYNILSKYQRRHIISLLFLSFIRYCVFTLQYTILLNLFEVNLTFIQAIQLISLIYLVLAIIPTIALAELGVRSSAAVYFMGMYSANSLGILSSSFLWIINLVVPALLGAVLIFRKRRTR